jgi:S1-C subfamily serine protease
MSVRSRCSSAALALALLAAAGPSFAQSATPADLSGKVLPSFVELSVQTTDGRTAIGTGFITVKDGILATAWHLVAQAQAVVAKFSNGEEFECSGVVDKDVKRNVALIRIKVFGRPVLKMEPVELPAGTPVVVPAVKDSAFGVVAASVGEPSVFDGVKQVRLDGDIPGTANGAPVVDAAGNVVGIVGMRSVDGKNVAFAVPAAYLLGLDASLATQPWGAAPSTAARTAAAAGSLMAKDDVDARLGQALLAVMDGDVCLSWAWENSLGMGFLGGVSNDLYKAQQTLETAAGALNEVRTDDDLRLKIGRAIAQILVNQKTATETFIRGVVAGQQAKSWIAQADDALKRAASIRQTVSDQIAGLKADLAALEADSAKFREYLPAEQRYLLGLAKRPSGYKIGVSTYPRNPFYLLTVWTTGLGYKIGLRPGDIVISAAGRTFTAADDFEEFKLIVKANLGKILPVEVERYGKRQTVKLKIPKEIPADAVYKD